VRLLPRLIRIEAWTSPQAEWMQSTLRLMAAEAGERRPGGETVVTRLADILVIQAIRSWIQEDAGARTGWLGALNEERIGPAILRIHREPSRACRAFKRVTGVAPGAVRRGGRRPAGEPELPAPAVELRR
jgi:hypothetical protein